MTPPRAAVLLAALLLAGQSLTAQQDLKRALTDKVEQLMELVQQIPEPKPVATSAPEMMTCGELQAALDRGGTVEMQARATCAGEFVIRKSGTRINGHGATFAGTSASKPTFHVLPDVDGVWLTDMEVTSPSVNAVIQIGDNGPTQTSEAQQPEEVILYNIRIPTHRGKRGVEFNGSGAVIDSEILDVYSAAGAESQALWLGNSCGPFIVLRTTLVGASENFMSGGDTNKMGCVPSVLVFDQLTAYKPDEWRGKVPAKNLFEIKAGRSVILRNSKLRGNWVSGQEGTAIVLTPRNGAYLQDILIDNVTVDDVALGIQILGTDNVTTTPQPTEGVIVRNSRFTMNKARNGGRGIPLLMVGGVLDVTFDNVDLVFDGNAIVVADGQQPQGPFSMRNSRSGLGSYAILKPGANFGNPTPVTHAGRELAVIWETNRLIPGPGMSASGLKQVKANFPANTYVTP
jgi:hypothetical protein